MVSNKHRTKITNNRNKQRDCFVYYGLITINITAFGGSAAIPVVICRNTCGLPLLLLDLHSIFQIIKMNYTPSKQLLKLGCSLLIIGACASQRSFSQDKKADPLMQLYRETTLKTNDLVHTKLDVRFDYKKRYLYGKEWLTVKPHCYATDSLRLDAKGMEIQAVALYKDGKTTPLKYTYDKSALNITLDKTYSSTDQYTLYIAYTAKPDELQLQAGAAITDAKGLYFINPDSTVKDKPVQIWTQGELESSSAWFPTIDHPNQKTTDEISMTVPAKYVTLSNGRLFSQKKNADGTRTDTWKMELPHAPYLFMMAVGNFSIYRDKWRDKEVSYYLEPKYAPYAKEIFGFTPEVMEFYSKILGVDYPWNKYAQIVVRDYVSGAMENTTATLHGAYVQGTARELADRYYDAGRSTIVHELFHQWFGDYVTAESWSNITVNESFADFSETLWAEHKYGKDAGDDHNNEALEQYLKNPDNAAKELVRFHYHEQQDVFDGVSYQKGGGVLNMLRNYLGAPAFFKGLNLYLKANAFKTGEAHQLRLAMEEASGKDLNWFFNQWYFGAGHPVLDISYAWDTKTNTQTVYLKQTQDGGIFRLPLAIDLYTGGKKERHQVWMNHRADTLRFPLNAKPELVNADADRILLAARTDHKTIAELWFQYQHAPLYMDRFEAIEGATAQQGTAQGRQILLAALQDKYYGLRLKSMHAIDPKNKEMAAAAMPVILKLAQTDENNLVRAAAINALAGAEDGAAHLAVYQQGMKKPSYAVIGASLRAIAGLQPEKALSLARSLEKESGGELTAAIISVYAKSGGDAEWPFVFHAFEEAGPQQKFDLLQDFIFLTANVPDPRFSQAGIDAIKTIAVKYKSEGFAPQLIEVLRQIKQVREKGGDQLTGKAADQAIQEISNSR